jgi:uncharacterized protein YaaW (UPF0174 family)
MSFTSETREMLRRAPGEQLAPIYERHDVPVGGGPKALVEEICLDGANTIASIFRGWEGVEYGEIVSDVAEQLGIEPAGRSPKELELAILEFIIKRYLENASPEERENLADVLKKAGADFKEVGAAVARGALAAGTLALLIRQVGRKVVAQVIGKIMLRIAGRQAAKEAGKRAAQLAGMAIPLLNIVMIGWTVVDIAGPAFRKTVPTVIEFALLRLEYGEET